MKLAPRAAWLMVVLAALTISIGCSRDKHEATPLPEQPASVASAQPTKPTADAKLETAVLAGGCFWGMEEILRKVPGVADVEVGYAGGHVAGATYSDVKKGNTGHAEAVRLRFDPTKLTFEELLEKWFFRMHDPTTKNRQGNDVGEAYRSAIFYQTPQQRSTALKVIARVEKSGRWKAPIVTEVSEAKIFAKAEEYHQDYLQKHPGGYTCHYLRD